MISSSCYGDDTVDGMMSIYHKNSGEECDGHGTMIEASNLSSMGYVIHSQNKPGAICIMAIWDEREGGTRQSEKETQAMRAYQSLYMTVWWWWRVKLGKEGKCVLVQRDDWEKLKRQPKNIADVYNNLQRCQ